ncbi:unnamed protein product [Phytophthora lilii]|uniref:Unnamed protein product n=1 Tax=Phytophthora lilii TaxID=2077276 RepID=A0A9W6X7Q7_9STRA|nr:unnamed protein product [Phytophthora lilii]
MGEWLLAVHAGAGRYSTASEPAYLSLLRAALESTRDFIASSSAAPSAPQVAARLLQSFETSTLTNAGLGSNLTEQSLVECEASVVCGETHLVSCCGAVRGVAKPSALALKLLEQADGLETGAKNPAFAFGRQPPLVVAGEHARELARDFGLQTAEDEDELSRYQVTRKSREQWGKWQRRFQAGEAEETKADEEEIDEERLDTVGAICMDPKGNVAAALSSGGVAFKVPGRLGLAGCPRMGCAAANAGNALKREHGSRKRKRGAQANAFAVACTGRGEHFIRSNFVGILMRRLAKSADMERALRKVFVDATEENGGVGIEGGVLALVSAPPSEKNAVDGEVSRRVQLGVAFTTPCMGVGFLQCGANAKPQVKVQVLRRPEARSSKNDGVSQQLAVHVSFLRLPVPSQAK